MSAAHDVLFNADLLRWVLRRCDAKTLARMGQCCPLFRTVGQPCWKALCKKDFPAHAKLAVTNWRSMYSVAAKQRCRSTSTPLLNPADLRFIFQIKGAKGNILLFTSSPAQVPLTVAALVPVGSLYSSFCYITA